MRATAVRTRTASARRSMGGRGRLGNTIPAGRVKPRWSAEHAGRRIRGKERPMTPPTFAELARMFDHSLLQPQLTDAELERGCLLAREYDVASVCIKPYAVKLAANLLAGSTVRASTTIGFPHGGHLTA